MALKFDFFLIAAMTSVERNIFKKMQWSNLLGISETNN